MASDISVLCTALDTAIRSLIPADYDVQEARAQALLFETMLRPPGVVWCYGGSRKLGTGPLGDRGRQDYAFGFTIGCVGMDWSTAAGAVEQARDIAERLRGRPTQAALPDGQRTPNLRTISLGRLGDDPQYLVFANETPTLARGTDPHGGRFALIQQWETGPLARI